MDHDFQIQKTGVGRGRDFAGCFEGPYRVCVCGISEPYYKMATEVGREIYEPPYQRNKRKTWTPPHAVPGRAR